jgi:hypothetical protein
MDEAQRSSASQFANHKDAAAAVLKLASGAPDDKGNYLTICCTVVAG